MRSQVLQHIINILHKSPNKDSIILQNNIETFITNSEIILKDSKLVYKDFDNFQNVLIAPEDTFKTIRINSRIYVDIIKNYTNLRILLIISNDPECLNGILIF